MLNRRNLLTMIPCIPAALLPEVTVANEPSRSAPEMLFADKQTIDYSTQEEFYTAYVLDLNEDDIKNKEDSFDAPARQTIENVKKKGKKVISTSRAEVQKDNKLYVVLSIVVEK